MIYVRENIPSKLLTKHVLPSDIECIFLELNFRKCKWLLVGTYHRPSQNDHYFFENLDTAIDVYSNYEKVLLVGDFKAEISEVCSDSFLYQHELKKKKHILKTFRILVALIFSWQIMLYLFNVRKQSPQVYQIFIS